jgi:hypothetical protein
VRAQPTPQASTRKQRLLSAALHHFNVITASAIFSVSFPAPCLSCLSFPLLSLCHRLPTPPIRYHGTTHVYVHLTLPSAFQDFHAGLACCIDWQAQWRVMPSHLDSRCQHCAHVIGIHHGIVALGPTRDKECCRRRRSRAQEGTLGCSSPFHPRRQELTAGRLRHRPWMQLLLLQTLVLVRRCPRGAHRAGLRAA